MASPNYSSQVIDSLLDQQHINCPVCGKVLAYDRWSHRAQRKTCSDECRDKLEAIIGDKPIEDRRVRRASDPSICIVCGTQLDGVRSDKLFCSWRCAKRAQRMGDSLDRYRRIRKSSIRGQEANRRG